MVINKEGSWGAEGYSHLGEAPKDKFWALLVTLGLVTPPSTHPVIPPKWGVSTRKNPAAAAKLLQSCPTLCDPIDGSPPGSPVPGILQARTLEWVAISFSKEEPYFISKRQKEEEESFWFSNEYIVGWIMSPSENETKGKNLNHLQKVEF